MHGDVGECVSIVAKKVQRICGQFAEMPLGLQEIHMGADRP